MWRRNNMFTIAGGILLAILALWLLGTEEGRNALACLFFVGLIGVAALFLWLAI
jgi:hypothetical protein